ncbi:hypothetical protein ABT336_02615 [Micromonospora sp. NPDC000207]|uniref:hypothetical protein n=1 Tax=Micromonospora sp. NPDC000207 TaxID=3154246 RepID=UPI00332C8BE2
MDHRVARRVGRVGALISALLGLLCAGLPWALLHSTETVPGYDISMASWGLMGGRHPYLQVQLDTAFGFLATAPFAAATCGVRGGCGRYVAAVAMSLPALLFGFVAYLGIIHDDPHNAEREQAQQVAAVIFAALALAFLAATIALLRRAYHLHNLLAAGILVAIGVRHLVTVALVAMAPGEGADLVAGAWLPGVGTLLAGGFAALAATGTARALAPDPQRDDSILSLGRLAGGSSAAAWDDGRAISLMRQCGLVGVVMLGLAALVGLVISTTPARVPSGPGFPSGVPGPPGQPPPPPPPPAPPMGAPR